MSFSAADHAFMARALQLARRGLYSTTPNPRVGCVIARDGRVIGEGWHEKAGLPHAEAAAIAATVGAGDAAQGDRDGVARSDHAGVARGATVYVTLEPCSHFGRTPPCADALIAAGVARVVAAMQDPNPLVAGQGLARLGAAGIEVASGLLQADATELNIGFVSRMTRGRPWLRLKVAASLDGKTALNNGVSQWITGPAARRDAHAWRARSCAVLTGIGTVKDDNPRLTVREVQTSRQPLKVVIDSRLETPPDAAVLEGGKVLIAAAQDAAARSAALRARGAEIVQLPNAQGKVDLGELLQELGRRGINEVLAEAGTRLNGSLLREGCVDELLIYQAPILLGDSARGMFGLAELTDLAGATHLNIIERRAVGADFRFEPALRDDDGHRDFPGRGLLINVLRIVHIAGLAGISAVVLAGAGGAPGWGVLMLVSGLGIVALDAWANPCYFRQAKGLGTLLKMALVLLLVVWEAGRLPLFWFVLAFSVALSHAPGWLRHRRLF